MTIIIFSIALAALVWGAIFLVRGSLPFGCLALLISGCCFGYEFVHFRLGPAPLTIDRLVLLGLVGAFFVQRRLGGVEPKPIQKVDLALGAFLGYLLVSTFTSDWRVAHTGQVSPLWRLLGGYLIPAVVYWIARQSPLAPRTLRWVHASLACFAVYLGVSAILEVHGAWGLVFPRYIADPEVGLHFGRARGPMVHAVTFGLYLGVGICCAWLWRSGMGRVGQLALIAATPLWLAGVYYSYTRSIWLGVGSALFVLFGLTLAGPWRRLVLGGMAAAAILVGATKMDDLVGLSREGTVADTRRSTSMRGTFAYVSWLMFLDRPLMGTGFGHFYEEKLPYLADRSTELELEAIRPYVHHNTFLSLLTETGAIGLGLFLLVLGGWGTSSWRLFRNRTTPAWARMQGALMLAVLPLYGFQLLFHELSYTPLDNSLLFFTAGLTSGLAAKFASPATVAADPLAASARFSFAGWRGAQRGRESLN